MKIKTYHKSKKLHQLLSTKYNPLETKTHSELINSSQSSNQSIHTTNQTANTMPQLPPLLKYTPQQPKTKAGIQTLLTYHFYSSLDL